MDAPARTPRQLGNLIRRARKQRGWSQSQLAERVGIRQGTISLIETGNPATRVDTLLALLAALDLELQVASRLKDSRAGIEDLF
jgi:HTH-type transcriptional regulator / antitoxin HipB